MSEFCTPKKKDWKPGNIQVSCFIRTRKGSTIQMTKDNAAPEQTALAYWLVAGIDRAPEQVREAVAQLVDVYKSRVSDEFEITKAKR